MKKSLSGKFSWIDPNGQKTISKIEIENGWYPSWIKALNDMLISKTDYDTTTSVFVSLNSALFLPEA